MTIERVSYLLVICARNFRESGDTSHPMTTTLRSQGVFVFRCDDAAQAARLEAGLKVAMQKHASSAPPGLVVTVSEPISFHQLGRHSVYCYADEDVSPEQYYLELLRFAEQYFANQLASIEGKCLALPV
jgi:hypothetical protein